MSQEPNHIDAVIADLEAWRGRIADAIETLQYLQTQGGGLPTGVPSSTGARTLSRSDIPHDAFFQMTVPDAAEKYLKLVKKTKPNPELATDLLKGGLKSAAKNFPEMIRTVLAREPRFVKVNGEWGLSEWYPGMRNKHQRERLPEPSQGTRSAVKRRQSAAKPKKNATGPSLRDRVVKYLESHPTEVFDAPTIAERIGAQAPSTAAALSGLLRDSLVVRPERSKYQSKKAA
jgi:hypothetical protein